MLLDDRYTAGIIDGEGTISITRRTGSNARAGRPGGVIVTVGMTDEVISQQKRGRS